LKATIHDIAKIAGVSKSTVSRVISGNGYVSPEAREKVLRATEVLNYRPNALARAMVSRHTRNIGVIIYRQHYPIASHPFYGKILDSILETAAQMDYSIFVSTDQEISSRSADFLLEKRVDGLILISRLNHELIDYFKGSDIPFVMVNGSTDDQDVIHLVNDDLNGGRMAADHFLACGYRSIAVIAGPQDHRSHSLRLRGFRARLAESGIHLADRQICYAATSQFQEGYQFVHTMRKEAQMPEAIFATNDMMAIGAIQAISETGGRIPTDIAVMGFDDIDFAAMSNPSLTTVKSAKSQMGRQAVEMLDQLIQGNTDLPKRAQFSAELIVRSSTHSSSLSNHKE
jgi:DNA-binding LacI/PurR family transcriptional regulator